MNISLKCIIVGHRIMAPQNVHILIFGTCETVTMHSNTELEDVIYAKFFEVRRLLWLILVGAVYSKGL